MRRLTLTAIVLVAACNPTPAADAPEGDPFARGPIVSITHHATASGILVGAGPGSVERCGISATADDATRYLTRVAPGGLRALERSALGIGDTVEVYVDGPVALSCPPQAHASAIVLVAQGE